MLLFFGEGVQTKMSWRSLLNFTVLEITSRNQGSELPSATMIPQSRGRDLTRSEY